MKRIFQTDVNTNHLDFIILLLRITAAVFMITHAIPKMNKFIAGGEIQFPDPLGIGASVSLVLAVFAELICSILIGFGFLTRLAAFPLIITMAVAAFIVHAEDPFKQKELALIYLVLYIVLLFIGSGKYSVDYFISKKKK
ncbi:MAG: DoxX family protein [Bacteroidetes bacterium]|nr:MAG: DoxX family protein [Bacteroidota bacterium]